MEGLVFIVLIGLLVNADISAGREKCNHSTDCICCNPKDACPKHYNDCTQTHDCGMNKKACCNGSLTDEFSKKSPVPGGKRCASNPCQNNGTCTDVGTDSFECTCAKGFEGIICEVVRREPCNSADCICVNSTATCPVNYSDCTETHDCGGIKKACCKDSRTSNKPCASNPCQNGGTCTDVGTDSFECTCAEGFEGTTCEDAVCLNPEMDLVYVIDGSSSIGRENFKNVKYFIQELNKRFIISANEVRVGIQEYSYPNTYVYSVQVGEINKNGNIDVLNDVVSNMPYLTGGTHTGAALQRARTVMFTEEEGNRANVTDVLILYTDGAASDKFLQIKEADLLKENGVKIICIGFGSQSAVQKFLPDLEKMASPSCEGTGKLVFQADFHELETIANSIVQEACNCA